MKTTLDERYREAFGRAAERQRQLIPIKEHRHGIVTYAGGAYLPSVYVSIRAIRHGGCTLPVEVWHIGPAEVTGSQRAAFDGLDVRFRDATAIPGAWRPCTHPGWYLKPFALRYTAFAEAIAFDADCYPVERDVTEAFYWHDYRRLGAMFWPDSEAQDLPRETWTLLGLDGLPPRSVESGCMVVDTIACARELDLTLWLNEHSAYYYGHVWGDKETFSLAWNKLGTPYGQVHDRWTRHRHSLQLYDCVGKPWAIHRVHDKWRYQGETFDHTPQSHKNSTYVGTLPLEKECFQWLREYKRLVDAK